MEVLFTFRIQTKLKEELAALYPEVKFTYVTNIGEAYLRDADVIVTEGTDITEEVLEKAPNLKWIMVAAVGVEALPLSAIQEKGIVLTNSRGVHKMPLAESVLAHLLSLCRGLPGIYERQREQRWKLDEVPTELNGSTAVILGPGTIGGEIGRLLQAFHVRTIGINRSGGEKPYMDEMASFQDLLAKLPEADFVISVLPSTPETKGILQYEHFKAMKPTAVFVNVGRGDLVKEEVIVEALENKEIRHAVLDVFEVEPLPVDSPLWTMENCTVSPHISSLSNKYIERSVGIMKTNLEKWLRKDRSLVNVVDLERGY